MDPKSIKLLIINDNTPDQINGVVTTYKNMIPYLESMGIDIRVIDPTYFKKITGIFYPDYSLPLNIWGLRKMIDEYGPTHVHIATEGLLGLSAKMVFNKKKWRYTTSYHTRWDLFAEKILGTKFSVSRIVKSFHKKSSKILVPTIGCQNILKDMGLEQTVVWSRGVNHNRFMFSDRSNHTGKPVLLNVGRISLEKSLDDFCSLDREKYDLVLVGDGPDLPRLKEMYPWVQFKGALTGDDLVSAYMNSDCFVFPSSSDTFGIVMIESMSVGTPIAAYKVESPISVVEQGINGYLKDSLEEAVKLCLQLDRKKVRQSSYKWDWKEVATTFKDHLVTIK